MRNFRFNTIQDLLILREELNKIFIEMEKGFSAQEENDVELHLEGSSLIVSGKKPCPVEEEEALFLRSECNYGHFRRIIRLKVPFDFNTIDAYLKDGILKIVVNKRI